MIVTQADLCTSHPHTMNKKICVRHVIIMPADIGISILVPHFLCIHALTTLCLVNLHNVRFQFLTVVLLRFQVFEDARSWS